jgi:hypothetical protein
MGNYKISNQEKKRILNLHESRTKKFYLPEQAVTKMTYSVGKNGDKFRIMVQKATDSFPVDAEKLFGKGTMWKDYTTQQDAQKVVDSLNNPTGSSPKEMMEDENMDMKMDMEETPSYTIGEGDYNIEIYNSPDGNHKFKIDVSMDDLPRLIDQLKMFAKNKNRYR